MSSAFDAFHLPGFDPSDPAVTWAVLEADDTRLRYPVLEAADVTALAARLRVSRQRALADRPVHDVVRALDQAARRLLEPGATRTLALELLPGVSRMSRPMIELVLERMAADWRAPALERLLRIELGDAALLDGFVDEPDAGRARRALGPALTLNVFAGNVPGVAVTAIVRCLLVKSAVIGKTAADDPVLPVLFARALAEVDADLAACVAVTYWPGGSGSAEDAALVEADTIVVYGGEAALRSVRGRAPGTARVLEHGPRMSYGFVAREALGETGARRLAREIARAVATFDQHGCVSPHGVFVESGGAVTPREMARRLFEEIVALERELPSGRLLPEESARLHAERARAEFAAMEGGGEVLVAEAGPATVVYSDRPDATPSCLDRFVRVSAVPDLEASLALLEPLAPFLQSAGLAAPPDRRARLGEALGRAGFTRIAPFASMPWPPAHWHHDGASPLQELVRWVDLEHDDG